ncbi:MAG: hypothetical protein KKH44_04835 [Bacteroidetes bacterium]|nr:hypothetical protein [Bacteroidota bacterium]
MFSKFLDLLTSSRFKSFYWRTIMMALAGFLSLLAETIGGIGLPPEAVVVIGLVFGEISKHINNKFGNPS